MDKSVCIISSSSMDSISTVGTKWKLCIICQQECPGQALVCPTLAKKRICGDGYVTLENDLLGFHELGLLQPTSIKLDLLNDGSGIANTLRSNNACWHKSCRDEMHQMPLNCRGQENKKCLVILRTCEWSRMGRLI